jgi:hypothetical protein
LDRNWSVCLTSINHPNTFATFLEDVESRQILFKHLVGESYVYYKYEFVVKNYTKDDIVEHLNQFLTSTGIGSATLATDSKLNMVFNYAGQMLISNYLLRVLGFNGVLDKLGKGTSIYIDDEPGNTDVKKENDKYIVNFKTSLNMDFLKPDYMIAYTNIVSSSIIGGIYSKILRIIPINKSEEDFVIKEFHHKEYIKLQNTEVSEIEIELRSHDGTLVNFGTKKDVILNLEFALKID